MTDKQRPEERPCGESLGAFHAPHRYMLGGLIYQCPGGAYHPGDLFVVEPESHPYYEVRTVGGERYLAEADEVRQDVGWVTFRADGVLTLSVRTTDVRTVRQVDPEEIEHAADAPDPRDAALARVRELPRKANNGETCVYCAHGQRLGYDTTWPCDTIHALNGTEQGEVAP